MKHLRSALSQDLLRPALSPDSSLKSALPEDGGSHDTVAHSDDLQEAGPDAPSPLDVTATNGPKKRASREDLTLRVGDWVSFDHYVSAASPVIRDRT